MIKRTTAIFFILLANIILLVHAVVPHHYHKSLVCIESSHCQSDGYVHNHSTSENDHEHDGSTGTETCILKQVLGIPSNSLKQELKYLGCYEDHSKFAHSEAIIFCSEFIVFVPKTIAIAQIPLITSSHSNFVSTSSGLRAPPVV